MAHRRGRRDGTTATIPLSDAAVGAWALWILSGSNVRVVPLPPERVLVIGRSSSGDVVLDGDGVSRRHAEIHVGRAITIADLDSHNGTRVRGRRLAAGERVELALGDAIGVGAHTIVVQRVSTTGPGPTAALARENEPRSDAFAESGSALHTLGPLIDRLARSDLPIIVTGETGVGKEIVATLLHARSARASGPLVPINCAALPDSILESELFGVERGAFTGAERPRAGLVESAEGGTLLLDEVAELSAACQAKLLRVLETKRVQRLGATSERPIDVRLVCATHRDLDELARRGAFRQDLYFRLNGFTLRIPPLRERRDEIGPLAERFARAVATRLSLPSPMLGRPFVEQLRERDWPGNVRELRQVVERAVVLAGGGAIELSHLAAGGGAASVDPGQPEDAGLAERERILAALARHAGNQTRAAKDLGMSLRTLVNRLDALQIARPRKPQT